MKNNKILAFVLSLCIVGGSAPFYIQNFSDYKITANAEVGTEYKEDNLTFSVYSDHAEVVSCDKSATGEIKIPATVNDVPVTVIGERAFAGITGITYVSMPSYPGYIKEIKAEAFKGCTGITSISIPSDVTTIGDSVFEDCTNLKSVYGSFTNLEFGVNVFKGTQWLSTVAEKNNGIVVLGNTVIDMSTATGDVELSDGITRICGFTGSQELTSVKIPKSVTKIDEATEKSVRAFDGIEKLTIKGYANTTAQEFANKYGYDFEEIAVNEEVYEGLKYIQIDSHVIITGYAEEPSGELIIPVYINNATVTEIADSAFKGCKGITSVTISNSGVTVGKSAFEGCTSINTLSLTNGKINSRAFAGCTSLENVYYYWFKPTMLADDVFEGCPDNVIHAYTSGTGTYCYYDETTKTLHVFGSGSTDSFSGNIWRLGRADLGSLEDYERVVIDEGVTGIGYIAFADMPNLKEVVLPESMKFIASAAFEGSAWLAEQQAKDPLVIWKNEVLNMSKCSGDVVIPDGIEYICGCSTPDVTSVTIPDSVLEIADSSVASVCAFAQADNLTIYGYTGSAAETYAKKYSINFVSLGESTVPAEKYLNYEIVDDHVVITGTRYTLPDNFKIPARIEGLPVTEIGESAFSRQDSITKITIPETVKKLRKNSFNNCYDMTDITIPKSVTEIGENSFYLCQHLTEITIKNPDCVIFDSPGTICTSSRYKYTDGVQNFVIEFTGVIKGSENSTAQAYAEKYGYTFEILSDNNTVSGDANGDGKVTLADCVAVLQYVANKEKYPLDETAIANADVYNKGDGLTGMDALTIQQYDSGVITSLPVE